MANEDKSSKKPKQRHRLLVNPEELGLTARIKKALLQQDMGITQRIKRVVQKTQDQDSFFYLQKNHFIMIGVLLFLLIFTGYLAFRTRSVLLVVTQPNGVKTDPLPLALPFYQGSEELKVPPYARTIDYRRLDIYGADLQDSDFYVTDENGQTVPNKKALMPGSYTIHITKPGYMKQELPVRVGESNMEVAVQLTPTPIPKRNLVLYINDPLRPDENIAPDNIILKNTGKSIQNIQVKPGNYVVEITKKGYHPKEMTIFVPENGVVRDKVNLDYKKRSVAFLNDDGLSEKGQEPKLDVKDITLLQEDKTVQYEQGLLMPGYYNLIVERDGYEKFSKSVLVLPGEDQFVYKVPLKTLPREVIIKTNYDITPQDVAPDKAFLKDIYGVGQQVIPITPGLKIKPRRYWVNVEKVRYYPFTKEVFITPGSEPFEIRADMILNSKTIIMKILSDFDVEPSVTPDEMTVDMMLRKNGYYPIDWGRLKSSLQPEKKQIEVTVNLITKPRKIVTEITSDISPEPVVPDLMTLTRVKDGQPGKSEDIKEGSEFKPGRYLLNIQKSGYQPIENEEVLVYPSDDNYVLKREMKPYARPFLTFIDSDYEPDKTMDLDEIFIDNKLIARGVGIKPGTYKVVLKKAGFESIEETVDILPANKDFEMKRRMKAKDRIVNFEIRAGADIIIPDLVTIDENELQAGAKIPPRKVYTFEIKKKGYVTEKFTQSVEPSDEPFILKKQMAPKKRKVILTLIASFPKNKDLLTTAETCLFHNIDARTGDVSVVPDKSLELYVVHAGYKSIKKAYTVTPDEEPLYINEIMTPKPRLVTLDLKKDVEPEDREITTLVKIANDLEDKLLKNNMEVMPERYHLEINVDGYEPITEMVEIPPSESPYALTRSLVSLPRRVVFDIKGDYPPEKLTGLSITLNGQEIQAVSQIKPGKHRLEIKKDGYHTLVEDVEILASTKEKYFEKQLKASPRVVVYEITDTETNETLNPDSVTLGTNRVTGVATFKPGRYQLQIKLRGYDNITEENFEVPPGGGEFKIERRMSPSFRLVQYELIGDYSVDALVPQLITLNGETVDGVNKTFAPGNYDLTIYVPGYERVNATVLIEPAREPYIIKQQLIAKKRKVIFSITGDFPAGIKLKPDKVALSSKEINDGEEVKPISGGYQVTVQKEGYVDLSQNVIIPPSEDDFYLELQLEARPRRIDLQVDSDYKPGVMMEMDEVWFDKKRLQRGDKVNPGFYTIILKKGGYETMTFKETVEAGLTDHIVKRTLIGKPREVRVKVMSDFTKEEMTPEILTLGELALTEKFKPGSYELNIDQLGYNEIREKIEVAPSDSPLVMDRTMNARNRKIREDLRYDVPPSQGLSAHITRVRPVNEPNPIRIRAGDELKPGDYDLIIEKEGYETLRKKMLIEPDDRDYTIDVELISKYVQVLFEIDNDIQPEKGTPIPVVTFIDVKTGVGRNVEHGKYIKPGDYLLEIAQPGYQFKTPRKKITVLTGTKPHIVKETLVAKPRALSFDFKNPETGQIIRAVQVLADNQPVKQTDTFNPGQKYNFTARFETYQTIEKSAVIPPGEGPYVLETNMVELKKTEFAVAKKYHDLTLNNIRYPVVVFADGQQLEEHHVQSKGDGFSLVNYWFYSLKKTRNVQVAAGFFYEDRRISDNLQFRDLAKIDADKLVEHLGVLAKGNRPFQATQTISILLRDRVDRVKLFELPAEKIEKVLSILRSLQLETAQEKETSRDVIKQLQQKE